MEADLLPTSIEVGESLLEVDVSRCKLSWMQMKLLNEATSMTTSMEVNGSKLTSMEVGGRFHGSLFTSVKCSGINFH